MAKARKRQTKAEDNTRVLAMVTVKGEELPAEQLARAISEKVIEFVDTVDLPKKFSFWWIISNVNVIRKLIEGIVDAIKEVKKNK